MSYNLSLNPGPIDNSLLYLGEEHKARKLFLNPEAGDVPRIDFKRGDASLWKCIKDGDIFVDSRVGIYIRRLGFEGLVSIGKGRKIDRPLIEALIERWRPETNTFHMPFGEVTITLEDVNVLWGLPIEGPAIAPQEESYTLDQRVEMCQRLLGFTPEPTDFKNNTIKVGRILQFLCIECESRAINADATWSQQYARCICLILVTNNLFADTNNAYASLHMLSLLEDIDACGRLSWGSAVLAYLYRELTKGTDPKTVALGGPMLLVQVWAWTRIRSVAPRIITEQVDWGKAYGARWSYSKISVKETTRNVLKAHRSTLQGLQAADFNWTPYRAVMNSLPEMCTSGQESWRAQCCLICRNIVEYHPVERVKRQFSLLQDIPPPFPITPEVLKQLRKMERKGRGGTTWSSVHADYVANWETRHENVLGGDYSNVPMTTNNYIGWFHRHTVLYITDPRRVPGVGHTGFQDHGGLKDTWWMV